MKKRIALTAACAPALPPLAVYAEQASSGTAGDEGRDAGAGPASHGRNDEGHDGRVEVA